MKSLKNEVAIFSKGIAQKPEIRILLDCNGFNFKPKESQNIEYVVGWGKKENTKPAKNFAQKHKLKYYTIEDGFLHSMGQGVLGAKSCSLVKDSTGIYYDATSESDLENLLVEYSDKNFNSLTLRRARDAIQRISKANISIAYLPLTVNQKVKTL